MRGLFPFNRMIGVTLVILVLSVSVAYGPAGASGPSGSPGEAALAKASIVAVPSVVDIARLKKTTLKVHGAGFTPGSVVSVGIRGLGLVKGKRDPAKDLWFGVATVNQSGAFTATVKLRRALATLISRKIMTKKELSSAWTLVVRNKEGDIATTPLIMREEKKKEKAN